MSRRFNKLRYHRRLREQTYGKQVRSRIHKGYNISYDKRGTRFSRGYWRQTGYTSRTNLSSTITIPQVPLQPRPGFPSAGPLEAPTGYLADYTGFGAYYMGPWSPWVKHGIRAWQPAHYNIEHPLDTEYIGQPASQAALNRVKPRPATAETSIPEDVLDKYWSKKAQDYFEYMRTFKRSMEGGYFHPYDFAYGGRVLKLLDVPRFPNEQTGRREPPTPIVDDFHTTYSAKEIGGGYWKLINVRRISQTKVLKTWIQTKTKEVRHAVQTSHSFSGLRQHRTNKYSSGSSGWANYPDKGFRGPKLWYRNRRYQRF